MASEAQGTQQAAQSTLRQMISGYQQTQLIYLAAALGLADLVKDGPRTSADLAAATTADPDALKRVLRALAHLGILAQTAPDTYGLTPLGVPLLSDAPNSLRTSALLAGGLDYHTWGALSHSVRTGKTAFEQVFGVGFFEYVERHPDMAAIFAAQMTRIYAYRNAAILDAYDFSSYQTIVDVGGGQGALLAAILARYPQATGILFDRPAVLAGVEERLQGVGDRCRVMAGDFFESIPTRGDLYLLAGILHDWPGDAARTILENCRAAMDRRATLLIADIIAPSDASPFPWAILDVSMLVTTGGRERTAAEFDALLASAGFERTQLIPLRREALIEAKPRAA